TARNEPVQELLRHEHSALLIERANPKALADAILRLAADSELATKIGRNAYSTFQQNCTIEQLGLQLVRIMEGIVKK
ncbi:MAG TPA: hypothetical protein PLZ01_09760, partial [bacterium]|nr:hypothetical protein [bacterium]